MVCDYRALNKNAAPRATFLPLISEALDQILVAVVLFQTDPIGAYFQMHIKDEDFYKTAIWTTFGSYEGHVVGTGLTSALAAFTR